MPQQPLPQRLALGLGKGQGRSDSLAQPPAVDGERWMPDGKADVGSIAVFPYLASTLVLEELGEP